MTQEKKENSHTFIKFLNKDTKPVILSHCDEGAKSALFKVSHEDFGTTDYRTKRILEKLAQFAAKGNIKQVAKLLNIRPDLRIEVLFTLAGLGAQDEMKIILMEHPEDLLVSHRLRDISGAELPSITLLQHAIWTKDVRYMANMFLDCLPKNEQGEKIRVALEQQVKEHLEKGVVYQLKGKQHSEVHFNLEPLLKGLRTYVENYNNWTDTERKSHWCADVGGPQVLVPAIIRHHYCDPVESFWDQPDFKKPQLMRSLEIHNPVVGESQLWSESLGGLGSDFGIYSARALDTPAPWGRARGACSTIDLVALSALDKVRTTIDMPALIDRLHTPIQNLQEDPGIQEMKI